MSAPVDGQSLVPLLEGGGDGQRTVVGEFLAETALAPMVMIRRGRWKLIHTPSDPDQLFDLEADPLELVNLAETPSTKPWSGAPRRGRAALGPRAVDRDVRASQQARLAVFEALQTGARSLGLPALARCGEAVHAQHDGRRGA